MAKAMAWRARAVKKRRKRCDTYILGINADHCQGRSRRLSCCTIEKDSWTRWSVSSSCVGETNLLVTVRDNAATMHPLTDACGARNFQTRGVCPLVSPSKHRLFVKSAGRNPRKSLPNSHSHLQLPDRQHAAVVRELPSVQCESDHGSGELSPKYHLLFARPLPGLGVVSRQNHCRASLILCLSLQSWGSQYVPLEKHRNHAHTLFTVYSALNLLGLYHDSILVRLLSPSPSPNAPSTSAQALTADNHAPPATYSKLQHTPSAHARYTHFFSDSNKAYDVAARSLVIIGYTELLAEMLAKRKLGRKQAWNVVVGIESVK